MMKTQLILSLVILAMGITKSSLAFEKQAKDNLSSQVDEIVQQYIEPNWFAGNISVRRDDNAVYSLSSGLANIEKNIPNTPQTKIRIGSINKHFTSVLVLQKVQAGTLSLDDKLARFDLGFSKEIASKISIRHLLQHKSGFADIFNQEYYQTYQSLKTISDKLPLLMTQPLLFEPGTKYSYSNYGYIVLGAILEKIENKTFGDILKNNILQVIGAYNTEYALTDQVEGKAKSYHYNALAEKIDKTDILENVTPDGGMYASASDLALFYDKLFYSNLLLNNHYKAVLVCGYCEQAKPWQKIKQDPKVIWRSYGGGPGVSAVVEVAVANKLMVIVLANTDGLVAEYMSQRIMTSLSGKAYPRVKLPMRVYAKQLLEQKGKSFFLTKAKQALAKAGYQDFNQRSLNQLGLALLERERFEDAITVLTVNSQLFANQANTYDSLAYAYEKQGNKVQAMMNYKAALKLVPDFTSSIEGVKRLSE